jgi:hypothetical protein
MSRRVGSTYLVVLLAVVSSSCSRGSAGRGSEGTDARPGASEPTGAEASAASAHAIDGAPSSGTIARSAPVFSAPISALRVGHQLVVAGLVAAEGIVRVMGLAPDPSGPERSLWSVDALRGVSWTPDAELHLEPAGDGLLVIWRGGLDGKAQAVLTVLGLHGDVRMPPVPMGSGACATADGVAWIEPHGPGAVRVRAKRWAETEARQVTTAASDRSWTLLCGAHEAYALGDGDDDLAATAFAPGDAARGPLVVIRDQDFGEDDEREHHSFASGDDMGLVRIGDSGSVSVRQLSGGHLSPWRRTKRALAADDDVVAVDGDDDASFVVFTREAPAPCPGTEAAAAVHVLRIDRKGSEDSGRELAPEDCGSAPGPFWIGLRHGAPLVGWTHRKAKPPLGAAPIDGLAFRSVSLGSEVRHFDIEADALVEAGCDEDACYAAALARGPEDDGGRPEAIVGIRYGREP